jgi:prepilin-type N-terminal cleavage/methylation domain-containing protein
MTHDRRDRTAFTLVELIVVTVIIAVLAGAIVPRIVSRDSRTARDAVEAARALLSAAGQRELLTSQHLAIDYAPGASGGSPGRLSLVSAADPGRGAAASWQSDMLAPPALLRGLALESASADGTALGQGAWRVDLSQGERRPEVVLVLTETATGRRWWLVLSHGSGNARAVAAGAPGAGLDAGTVDLDQVGMRDDPW